MKKLMMILILCVFFTGCQKTEENKVNDDVEKKNSGSNADMFIENRSVDSWVVYWDMDSAGEEMKILGDNLRKISYFGAYFDKDYKVSIPEGFIEACENINNTKAIKYLSVVNDVVYEDGRENLQKDIQLLYALLEDEKRMLSHVEELIQLAKSLPVDGLEIDYENIRKDERLWTLFETFIARLNERLLEENLSLRIDLEPSAPIETLDLPEEAECVIMCYNLYSGVDNEGPKADEAFLKALAEKAKSLKGNCVFALATGGFDWSKGEVTAVKEKDVFSLIIESDAEVTRDQNSDALTFTYQENGREHTVWYADGDTMKSWISWILEIEDYDIAIWRLNGNESASIKAWTQ